MPSSELGLSSYNVYRCDRNYNNSSKRIGGGTLIAISRNFASYQLIAQFNTVEQVSVMIPSLNLIIICVYIPSSMLFQTFEHFCLEVEHLAMQYPLCSVIIMGDLNLANLDWNQPLDKLYSCTLTPAISSICSMMAHLNLTQHNSIPNANQKILDVVLSQRNIVVTSTVPLLPMDNHHPALECILPMDLPGESSPSLHQYPYNFKKEIMIKCMNIWLQLIGL